MNFAAFLIAAVTFVAASELIPLTGNAQTPPAAAPPPPSASAE